MEIIDKLGWIFIKNKKILFVRSSNKNIFYHPGGKREAGETDEQALAREVKEELNVDLKPGSLKYIHTFQAKAHKKPEGVMVEVKCYEADFAGEFMPNAEIAEFDWLTSQDMHKVSDTGKLTLVWLKKQKLID